jgi:transcriptional regulator GlxA family with amidase domain
MKKSVTPLAEISPTSQRQKQVVFLVLPAVELLDLAGPAQAFYIATQLGAKYQLVFCAGLTSLASAQGLVLAQLAPPPSLESGDSVIIPGSSLVNRGLEEPLLDTNTRIWLKQAHQKGVHIASVCTGAFALGEAGLLDGRRCTTHWLRLELLQKSYPKAQVLDNVLFINDHNITSSAGIASGIDMALAVIEKEQGPIFTAQVAHYLVVYLRRNGMQQQSSIYLEYRSHLHTGVHRAQDFIVNHLTEHLTLENIANTALMSERSLNRSFKDATGLTPIQYQQYLRLELAKTLMLNSHYNLDEIANKCGFETPRHFRRLWKNHFGVAPSVTRQAMC